MSEEGGGGAGRDDEGAAGRASAPDLPVPEPSVWVRALRKARPRPQPTSYRWVRRPEDRPLILGHRGARAHSPENTLAAFERAMDDGADGVELDVRTSADGTVVVLHDADLARVTGARDLRAAARLTAAELAAVELDGGARVPTLAEVLTWAGARGALLNVELKHDVPDRGALARETARLLRAHPRAAPNVIVSSFEPRLLAWMAMLAREVPRALLVHAGQRLAWTRATPLAARALGCVAVHPQHTLCSPAIVHALRGAGFVLNTWTVNDAREARELSALRVDGIITDDPAAIRAALAASRGSLPNAGAR